MDSLEKIKRDVRKALKDSNKYSKSLEMQILSLSTAIRTLKLSTMEIGTLQSVTVLEKTRYGEKLAPHPAFKIQKDAQDSVTRQMKALGLNSELLAGAIEDDPLVELTKEVLEAGRRQISIIPNGIIYKGVKYLEAEDQPEEED